MTSLQFARLEHFHHDVAAADEFALHVKLGDRRPVRERLDALADFHVLQHVHAFVLDAQMIEDGDGLAGKAALREQRRPLHEQDDVIGVDDVGDTFVGIRHGCWKPWQGN